MKWTSQRSFANSKIVKSSPIWLLVVPIAAKSFSTMNDVLNIKIFGETFSITTSLPFSWQILFFAACSFTLAGIIYSIFCPTIIKKYKNYKEFENDGKSRLQINCYLRILTINKRNNEVYCQDFKDKISVYLSTYIINTKVTGYSKVEDIYSVLDDMNENKGKNSNAFYFVDYIANEHNQVAIRASMILYLLGYALISILAFQNIYYVLFTS